MRPVGIMAFSVPLILLLLLGISMSPLRIWAAFHSAQLASETESSSLAPDVIDDDQPAGALHQADSTGSKRRLFIHIGPHKTGTTYFQTWLKNLGGISDTLVYPKICGRCPRHVWYAHYADFICNLGKWEHVDGSCLPNTNSLITANELVEDGIDYIVSSEAFSQCKVRGFIQIYKALQQAFDVYVVGVRRDPRSLFLSRFHEIHKDFEKPDRLWDSVIRGDKRAHLCSYMSVACVEKLARVFGSNRVVTVSYEGMRAEGKELADVLCEEYSTSECYKLPENVTLTANSSPEHIIYSALGIYNRLRILLGCEDNYLFSSLTSVAVKDKARYNNDFAPNLTDAGKALHIWMDALQDSGVRKNCLPSNVVKPNTKKVHKSDAIFHWLVKQGELPGRHLYYEVGGDFDARLELCEFDEAAVWESQETLERLIGVIRNIASCHNLGTLQSSLHMNEL